MSINAPPYAYYVYTLSTSIPTELTRFSGKHGYVFYVGKGVGIRIHWHEEEARIGHGCRKCQFIRNLWACGGKVKKQVVYIARNEADAYRYEAMLIQKIGLSNLVNSHRGTSSYMTEAQKMAELYQKYAEEDINN